MSAKNMRKFIPLFLLSYFVFGVTRWASSLPEIYPVAAWGMFQKISKTHTDYDIRLRSFRNLVFDPPISLQDPLNPSAIVLDGHARLVINGYVRFLAMDRPNKAHRYREFIEQQILGPDTEYELIEMKKRSWPSEKDRETEVIYGPFRTDAWLAGRQPQARFQFEASDLKFGKPRDKSVRREKKRKRD